MTRCPDCVASEGTVCLAIADNHARVCEWAKLGGIYAAYVRDHSHVGTPPSVADPVSPLDPKFIVRIETCDFRHSDCHCLSKPATCRLATWPSVVSLDDCIQCPIANVDKSPVQA